MSHRGSHLSDVLQSVGQRVASAANEAARAGGTVNRVGRSNVVVAGNVGKSGSVDVVTSSDVSSIRQGTARSQRRSKHPWDSEEGS